MSEIIDDLDDLVDLYRMRTGKTDGRGTRSGKYVPWSLVLQKNRKNAVGYRPKPVSLPKFSWDEK